LSETKLLVQVNKSARAGKQVSVDDSVQFLQRFGTELQQIVQGRDGNIQVTHTGVSCPATSEGDWIPPASGELKINVDGAFNPTSEEASIGVIIRDQMGNPKLTAWRLLSHCRNAEEAEAQTCLEGVCLASRWPNKNVWMESDCVTIVDKVNSGSLDRSSISGLISDIKQEGPDRTSFKLSKICRSLNLIAHELA